MNEIWRTIRGWEGLYQASSDGRIRSLDHLCVFAGRWGETKRLFKGNIVKQNVKKDGYRQVVLSKNGVYKTCKVHTLVADAFPEICGERLPGYEVSHLDENPANNKAENLRWVSHTANINWGTRNDKMVKNRLGKNACKPVRQYKDGVVKEYQSIAEAARAIGGITAGIYQALKKGYQYKNYKWEYVN